MLALLALICFILALFGAHIGSINLEILGFVFVAAHLLLNDTYINRRILRR